jgi:hypothetical protein
MVRPADTTAEAWQVHLATLRRLTGPERVALAFEMSAAARALSEAGIRHRHPAWGDGQVQDALMEMLLGRELANAVRRAPLVPV